MNLLERVEQLAMQAFGRGAAVSVDRSSTKLYTCSVWRPDGSLAISVRGNENSNGSRDEVIKIMLMHLKDECARLNEPGPARSEGDGG